MAHIANLLVEAEAANNYMTRVSSPTLIQDAARAANYLALEDLPVPVIKASTTPVSTPTDEKEKFVWRMHQPTEAKKYQLFPSKDRLTLAPPKIQEEVSSNGAIERAQVVSSVRGKVKEQTLVRRRKASVSELGPAPMTTVQEVAMDSPTIPGRPALHERSISAPGNNSWRQHPFGESMLSCISGPALDENAEMILDAPEPEPITHKHLPRTSVSPSQKQVSSPRDLTPLVIPNTTSHMLNNKISSSRLRSESIPPDVPPKSARMKEGSSPYSRASPYTPMSAQSTALLSASTAMTSVSGTPMSAFPSLMDTIASPSNQPWSSALTLVSSLVSRSATPLPTMTGHSRNQSDISLVDDSHKGSNNHAHSHRRHESESAASIMERGRPKKRSETSPSHTGSPAKALRAEISTGRSVSNSNLPPSTSTSSEKESAAKVAAKSEAQHAFEHLPTGIRPHLTPNQLPITELAQLKRQALGQASRFEVLPAQSVEILSRELRALDERCDYLRKTHRSLRSGRRNLHERICNSLRGERTAVFSRDSLLKQEEALSELDSSIDDWVAKLEQAENRRTRVRQKLLEHVAAALIIPEPASGLGLGGIASLMSPSQVSVAQKAHVSTMASVVTNLRPEVSTINPDTPPRSPTKVHSPERTERVVEEVKFSSPEPKRGGQHVESIRIYAESDVYALLADVEEEIERMGNDAKERARVESIFVEKEREVKAKDEREIKAKVERELKIEREQSLSPGVRLHPVAFEGMIAHKRSYNSMRT